MGASCPEVFIQYGDDPWRHLGSILVGSDTPARARSELRHLGMLSAGLDARVVLREVPGEQATIEARLWARTGRKRTLLDTAPITELDARGVMVLRAPAQVCAVNLELEVAGFFIRRAHEGVDDDVDADRS